MRGFSPVEKILYGSIISTITFVFLWHVGGFTVESFKFGLEIGFGLNALWVVFVALWHYVVLEEYALVIPQVPNISKVALLAIPVAGLVLGFILNHVLLEGKAAMATIPIVVIPYLMFSGFALFLAGIRFVKVDATEEGEGSHG